MAYLKRPQRGQRVLQSLYDSVNSILDYLPSITVRGDNYSTYVEHSSAGTIIHAKHPSNPDQTGTKGNEYIAGSGIAITSGNFINALLSAGPNIHIDYNSGYFVISGTPAGSGGSSGNPPSNGRFNTIGAGNSVNSTLSGCGIVAANLHLNTVDPPPNYYITINETASGGYNLISCDLTHLTQLYNYDLVADVQDPIGYVNTDHYVKALDFFLNSETGHRGLGTQISLFRHSTGNKWYDQQTGEWHLVNPIMGLKVDLTVSGGNWIGVSAVPRQIQGFDVDPQELEINCLLTGTYNHSPHTTGFIDIVPVEMEDGQTWGVISTNLHAGSGIAIDPQTGEISCTGSGGSSSNQSKTGFLFEPGIYQAEPNTTYYTSYKNQSNTFAYDAEDLQSYFNTDNIDDSGDIVIALPSVNYPTMVQVTNFDNSNVVVVTQDKKYIVVEDGGMQGWDSGQESDPVEANQTRVYVFQPTPIHWTDRYTDISGACNTYRGVWWMQKFT